MSTDQTPMDEQNAPSTEIPNELDLLKQRARMLGVEFSNNIGIETLRKRIEEKLNETPAEAPAMPTPTAEATVVGGKPAEKPQTLREKLVADAMRLIRLRITNLDPKKKDLPGEIFTVANEYIGTVRKYIPYGEVTDDGYHVPYCIYRALETRRFLNIRTYKDRNNNNNIKIEQTWAKEFALEVLPPLTQEELNKLAAAQRAAGGV